jgi:acetyl esterase
VVTHDPFCLLLSELAGVIILSVEYRLAPEHRYPAALEDTIAAYRWAAAHAVEFGGDASRLALGGDSAGGNLAAAAANQLCAAGEGESLRAQMLLYPVTDRAAAQYPSRQENATGYGLELPVMEWFWQQYAGAAEPGDPGAYPLHQQPLPKLPPTLVTTAEYDLLRDEGIAYAEKLKAAGVAVTHRHAADMHHNFPISPGTVQRFPQSVATLREIAVWLRETLSSR